MEFFIDSILIDNSFYFILVIWFVFFGFVSGVNSNNSNYSLTAKWLSHPVIVGLLFFLSSLNNRTHFLLRIRSLSLFLYQSFSFSCKNVIMRTIGGYRFLLSYSSKVLIYIFWYCDDALEVLPYFINILIHLNRTLESDENGNHRFIVSRCWLSM